MRVVLFRFVSQDDNIFSEADFGRENGFENPNSLLGESAALFETDLQTNDDAAFSGVEFDEAGSLLKSRKVIYTHAMIVADADRRTD